MAFIVKYIYISVDILNKTVKIVTAPTQVSKQRQRCFVFVADIIKIFIYTYTYTVHRYKIYKRYV